MTHQATVDVDTIREAATQVARWRDALVTMLSDEQRQALFDGAALQSLRDACADRGLADAPLHVVTAPQVRVAVWHGDTSGVVAEGDGTTIAEAADACRERLARA